MTEGSYPIKLAKDKVYVDIAMLLGRHIKENKIEYNDIYKIWNEVYRDIYKDKEN